MSRVFMSVAAIVLGLALVGPGQAAPRSFHHSAQHRNFHHGNFHHHGHHFRHSHHSFHHQFHHRHYGGHHGYGHANFSHGYGYASNYRNPYSSRYGYYGTSPYNTAYPFRNR